MTVSPNLEDQRRIVLSHRLASQDEVEQAVSWGAEEHPERDLAEHLFMRGVIDRQQVSLVRRLAKMARPSARLTPGPLPRPGIQGGASGPGQADESLRPTLLDTDSERPTVLEEGPTLLEPPPAEVPTVAPSAPPGAVLGGDTVLDRTVLETPDSVRAREQLETGLLKRPAPAPEASPVGIEPTEEAQPVGEPGAGDEPSAGAAAAKAGSGAARVGSAAARVGSGAAKVGSGAVARSGANGGGGSAAGKIGSGAVARSGAGAKLSSGAAQKLGGAKPAAAGKPAKSGANSGGGAKSGGGAIKPGAAAKPGGPASSSAGPADKGKSPAASGQRSREETSVLPSRAKKLEPGDPQTVGRYEVLERVARGGMGVVYRARHPELDRVFALKLLTARMKNTGEAIARFQREAKLAARLDHPNVVRVYDADSDAGGAPFLIMDFVDGPDLDDVIRDEGLGVRKAAQIARSVALALEHAHERGIVHRDVKPENIILDRATGEPKLTDFGIVKDLEGTSEEEKKLTRTGYTLGSPCYMSPEQAAGRHDEVGPRSDVYSLSAALYEMLTGGPPFDGDAIHDIMVKVIQADPVPLRVKNPAIPADLEVICLKGLEKEPARRYQTAAEMAEDLRRFLEDEPILAKPAGWRTKAGRFMRRHRSGVFLTAVLLLATLGGAGFLWQKEREQRQRELEERAELLIQAERLLADARRAEGPLERRRSLYDSLLTLERVLDRDPTHERALERKREVLLTLGDQLIESGEASFAEFVFGLGQDLLDAAVISSRLEAARIGRIEELAHEREAAGDLEEALRLLRRSEAELTAAGYSAARLQARIAELGALIEARRRQAEVQRLVAQADAEAEQGHHAQAWRTLLQALELEPEDQALEAQAARHQGKAEESARLSLIAAEGARTQALGVLGKRVEGPLPPALQTFVTRGDGFLGRGKERLGTRDYLGAERELEAAHQAFGEARRVATVLHAQAGCEEAAARAEEANAARFAPRELGQARELRTQAQAAFERGRLEEAVQQFERAAEAFRAAARTGSGKESVSDAWKEAHGLRARAWQELGPDHRLPAFQQAEETFQLAEAAHRREDWGTARELFQKTSAAFRGVVEKAEPTREAFALQARAQGLRREASTHLAEQFAPDELRDADALLREASQALSRSDPLAAIESLRKAIYRLERIVDTCRPQAEGQREVTELREQVIAARTQAQAANLTWKPGFKSAEQDLGEGDRLKAEAHWRLAKRRYERALRGYLELVR